MNEDEAQLLVDRLAWLVPDRPVPMGRLFADASRAQRRRRRVRAGIAVASAAVVVSAGAVALGSSPETRATDPGETDKSRPAPSPSSACPTGLKYEPDFGEPLVTKPPYPTNASGQTYGSDAGVNNPLKDGPVLAAVVGDCGKAGFVYETDLMGPEPTSPADALRIQKENEEHAPVLPVYEVDGKTQIDTFTLAAPSGSVGSTDTTSPQNEPAATLDGDWTVHSMVRFLVNKPADEALSGGTYIPNRPVHVTFTATTWTVEFGCARIQGGYQSSSGTFTKTNDPVHSSGSACRQEGDWPDVVNVVNLFQRITTVDTVDDSLAFYSNVPYPLLVLSPN